MNRKPREKWFFYSLEGVEVTKFDKRQGHSPGFPCAQNFTCHFRGVQLPEAETQKVD